MLMMSFYRNFFVRNFFVRNFFVRCVIGFLFVGLCFVIAPLMVSGAKAQSSQVETLDRIEALEEGMKQVRGVLEENLHALTQSVEGNQGLSQGDTAALQQQFLNLSQQIERTLEIASANEARLLRLEKRLEGLAQLGVAGGPANTGSGETPTSSLTSRQDQSALWAIDADTLERELGAAGRNAAGENIDEATADDQYQFALGKALQNDLLLAEQSFEEFIAQYPTHEHSADAVFWLGRVQFMQGAYEKATETFSEFQSRWPEDARVEKTTLWIGEAVTNFASKEEACELLDLLPSSVSNPTEDFFARLEELKSTSECSS